MSFINKIGSALGKLLIVASLAAAFLFGAGYVVYRSLQGSEITVPEIVGKNFDQSEKEYRACQMPIGLGNECTTAISIGQRANRARVACVLIELIHNFASGGAIEFRNVKIRPLPAKQN